MLLTQKEIVEVIRETLPTIAEDKASKIALTIVERQGQWKEISLSEIGAGISIQCKDICALGDALDKGCRVRAFMTS